MIDRKVGWSGREGGRVAKKELQRRIRPPSVLASEEAFVRCSDKKTDSELQKFNGSLAPFKEFTRRRRVRPMVVVRELPRLTVSHSHSTSSLKRFLRPSSSHRTTYDIHCSSGKVSGSTERRLSLSLWVAMAVAMSVSQGLCSDISEGLGTILMQ